MQLSLLRPLQALLVSGEPVTVAQLATRAGRSAEEIRGAPATMPDTEYDTEGRIIGYGLTFHPTPHRYETHARTFYTWCALDTVVFQAILGESAQVTSPCRATGEPVRLTATPDGPTDLQPTTAVVSLVAPDARASVRSFFCRGREGLARRTPRRARPARRRRLRGRAPLDRPDHRHGSGRLLLSLHDRPAGSASSRACLRRRRRSRRRRGS
ncbi:organomercurial lyase [Streptomyces regalis]|uniref:organomercurial lyase n=1 Tax=Streptomyces regalis TaxID=68262 RepID=UPI001FC9B040|nr:organomercurial lyase [Streptomyces regalis]